MSGVCVIQGVGVGGGDDSMLFDKLFDKDFTVIVVGDHSGSMGDYMRVVPSCLEEVERETVANNGNFVMIAFDDRARCARHVCDIPFVRGGGTSLPAGFEMLNLVLNANPIPADAKIFVIFVSDGQDSHLTAAEVVKAIGSLPRDKKLGRVVFISAAFGSGFPTHIALDLRHIYHTGNGAFPFIYGISVNSDIEPAMNEIMGAILRSVRGEEVLMYDANTPAVDMPAALSASISNTCVRLAYERDPKRYIFAIFQWIMF